jgi:hypothetical protein
MSWSRGRTSSTSTRHSHRKRSPGQAADVLAEPASIDRLYELYRERPVSAEDNQGQAAVP